MAAAKREQKPKRDYVQEVADRVIEQLENGTAPWLKPWSPGESFMPLNPTTGKPYRGMNSVWLMMQGREDPRWLTYRQAEAAGAQVRKGEKGTLVQYWIWREDRAQTDERGAPVLDGDGKPRRVSVELERPKVMSSVVFNAAQIDGLPEREAKPVLAEFERHARAERMMAASPAPIRFVNGDSAHYNYRKDEIVMPLREQFRAPDFFYSTALHEIGHSTAHKDRLDRDIAHPFGSEGYAKEELRAEIASLMLGEQLGIGHDPGQHAAYIQSWIKVLKNDPREIFRAAADAEKILKYMIDLERKQELAQAQGVTLENAQHWPKALGLSLGLDPEKAGLALDLANDARLADWFHEYSDDGDVRRRGAERIGVLSGRVKEFAGETRLNAELMSAVADWTRQEGVGLAGDWYVPAPQRTHHELSLLHGNSAAELMEAAFKNRAEASDLATSLEAAYVAAHGQLPEYAAVRSAERALQAAARTEAEAAASIGSAERLYEAQIDSTVSRDQLQSTGDQKMTTSDMRVNLAVPYAEKDQAKAAGARWDKAAKTWYAPAGADLDKLAKWRNSSEMVQAPRFEAPEREFAVALAAAGLQLAAGELPVMDGEWHRVPVQGDKKGARSGSYKGFTDGHPAGIIQNFLEPKHNQNWKSERPVQSLTADERAALVAESAERKAAQAAEQLAEWQAVASVVSDGLVRATEPTADHPYLKAKDVPAYGVKVMQGEPMLVPPGAAEPMRFSRPGELLVPVTDVDGNVWGAQSIGEGGRKSFPRGGRLAGMFHMIGDPTTAKAFVVAEGYATGATIHQATGLPVAVAFNANNLQPVAEALAGRFPEHGRYIAGDNDHVKELAGKQNVGRMKAEEAAHAVNGVALIPQFEAGDRGTDWNDLRNDRGVEELASQLRRGLAIAERKEIAAGIRAEREQSSAQQQAPQILEREARDHKREREPELAR